MSFKSIPLAQDIDERKLLHSIFNDWLCQASEDDHAQLINARELFAPNQVCSAVTLIRGCMVSQDLAKKLPQSLRQLMLERNWPQACVGAKAL